MLALMVREMNLIKQFRDISLVSKVTLHNVLLGMLKLTNSVLGDIREGHKSDLGLIDQLVLIDQGKKVDFRIDENGVMRFEDRIYVPSFSDIKKKILEEGHRSGLSIQPGATKVSGLKRCFGGRV